MKGPEAQMTPKLRKSRKTASFDTRFKRRRIMRSIKSQNTRPSLLVLTSPSAGIPVPLHRNDLSGKPDLVFPGK